MKKRILSMLLCICILSSLFAVTASAAAKTVTYDGNSYHTTTDGIMAYRYNKYSPSGSTQTETRFDIIGYYNNWTSSTFSNSGYITRVKFSDSDIRTVHAKPFSEGGCQVGNLKIGIDLVLSNGDRTVKIVYTVKNTGTTAIPFALGSGADIKIAGNDKAKIRKFNNPNGSEGGFTMSAGDVQFNFFGKGYNDTNTEGPDVTDFWYGPFGSPTGDNGCNVFVCPLYDFYWSANKDSAVFWGSLYRCQDPKAYDSTASWHWASQSIKAGETKVYTVRIGIGGSGSENAANYEAPTAINRTFDRTTQNLINPGRVINGTMEYGVGTSSTQPSSWSTSIPKATDAGTYYVWYRAIASGGSSETGKVTVTISPKNVTAPTAANQTYTYNGNPQTLVLNNTTDQTWYTISNATQTNAGTYTVTASLKNPGNGNVVWRDGSAADRTIPFTINKAAVAAPTIASKAFTGTTLTADIADTALYTVTTNNGGISVGTYDVVLTLTDADNYKWTDSEDAVKNLTFKIEKSGSQVAVSDVTATYGDTITLTADISIPQSAAMMSLNAKQDQVAFYCGNTLLGTANVAYDNNGTTATATLEYNTSDRKLAIGENTVTAVYGGSVNLNGSQKNSIKVTLNPKTVPVSIIPNGGVYGSSTAAIVTYDSEFLVGSDNLNVTLTYTGTANNGTTVSNTTVPTLAGNYTVTASQPDGYYTLTNTTAEFVITKQPVTAPTIASKVFTGTKLTADVATSDLYHIVNNGGTDVGDYPVTLTLKDANNYKWTDSEDAGKTLTFSITKSDSQVTASGLTATYGDTIDLTAQISIPQSAAMMSLNAEQDRVAFYCGNTLLGTANVAYDNNGATGTATLEYNTSDRKLAIGENTVTAVYGGSVNLNGSQKNSIKVTLKPKTVPVSIIPNGGVYGSSTAAIVTYDSDLLVGSDYLNVTLTYTGTANNGTTVNSTTVPTLAGNYTVTASQPDGYYALTNTTAEFVITKQPVTAPTIASKVFTGTTLTADVADTALYTVTTNNGGIAVGTYDVVLTLKDAANYKWTDSEDAVKNLNFCITKSDSQVTVSDVTATYGDTIPLTADISIPQSAAMMSLNAEQDQVAFYCGNSLLGTANVAYDNNGATGTATLQYKTADRKLAIGENIVTAVYGGSVNLNGSQKNSIKVTLNPKTVPVAITPNGGVYGQTITPATASYGTTVNGETLNLTLTYTGTANDGTTVNSTTAPTLAGTYTVTASQPDGYYTLTNTTADFVVAKQEVLIPTIASKVFTGGTLTADVAPSTLYSIMNEGGINAGDYNVVLTLGDTNNYKWSDGTETAVQTLTFSIVKSDSQVTTSGLEATYGETITLTAEISIPATTFSLEPQPAYNEVVFYCKNTEEVLGTVPVTPENGATGTATLEYNTSDRKLAIGENEVIAYYGGSVNLNNSSKSITITLQQKPLTVTAVDQTIVYGNEIAKTAEYALAKTLVSNDDLADVALSTTVVDVPVSELETEEIKVANAKIKNGETDVTEYYSISYVCGDLTIRKAQQAAPAAPVEQDGTTAHEIYLVPITTTGFGQVEYAISTTNAAPAENSDAWTTAVAYAGLERNTEYYFFSRYAGDSNHHPAVSEPTMIKTLNTYPVTLITNGGTIHKGNVDIYEYGVGAILPTAITKFGYNFGGWYDNKACIGTPVKAITTTDYGAKTFWAQWYQDVERSFVHVDDDITGGTVVADKTLAWTRDTITITVSPTSGNKLTKLTVTDNLGRPVTVNKISDTEYTFQMPDGNVYVDAAFSMITGSCLRDKTCPMFDFTDLDTTAWYHDGIHFCLDQGLMNGVGNQQFDPNGTSTRAMIVTILWRLEGSPVVHSPMTFNDVADGMWYTEAIRWASSKGIVTGYSAAEFGPNDTITREQIMAILNRYAVDQGWTDDLALTMAARYNCSVWAENNVNWAEVNGLLDNLGVDVTDMTAKASRAELATYLQRVIEYVANV